jgi:hypothetical protein
MNREIIERRFTEALDTLVGQVSKDRAVLAAILCGSLSHDTVWEKSDIDLVLVTIDDKRVPASDIALSADSINVHAILMPRAEFRKTVEGSLRNSFVHSLLAKGRLLYTQTRPSPISATGSRRSVAATRPCSCSRRRRTRCRASIRRANGWSPERI